MIRWCCTGWRGLGLKSEGGARAWGLGGSEDCQRARDGRGLGLKTEAAALTLA